MESALVSSEDMLRDKHEPFSQSFCFVINFRNVMRYGKEGEERRYEFQTIFSALLDQTLS